MSTLWDDPNELAAVVHNGHTAARGIVEALTVGDLDHAHALTRLVLADRMTAYATISMLGTWLSRIHREDADLLELVAGTADASSATAAARLIIDNAAAH